ncbi:FAD-linked oxidase [Robertkochia solimangrovi]|nr:FAD-linked oxidase [Robertkochia solimangrovi]
MAITTTFDKETWDTLHNNGPFPLKKLHITQLEGSTNMPSKFDRYKDAATEVQRLIGIAASQNEGFRAYGARWSLSYIAHQKEHMHYNRKMNLHIPVLPENMEAGSLYKAENLFFFECGNTIKRISEVLFSHGKSLKTSGASNGQTIAGCISTGVHGSALDVGAVQDYVVGINLIIGDQPGDIVYLERSSRPALNKGFADTINSRIIRDDDLFNAALVGLGAFGFIHGVAIEAENLFLLKRYVRKIDKNIALQLADTMDFTNSSFKIPGETSTVGKPLIPYHYKVFMNPYIDDQQYVVELMYKKPYSTAYPDPFPVIETSIYRDLIYLLVRISEKFPQSIPWFIKKLEKSILPDVDEETLGTLYETFWDAPYQGPAFACSVGVDHKDASKAYQLLEAMTRKEGPIPGIFAMRFVKQTEATLGFTKFPITCMLEIDGVLWKKSEKLLSLREYGTKMIETLQANHIPFTIHWGKNSDWAFPGLVNYMFGNKATEWKQQRNSLLSPKMQKVFSNQFLKDLQLTT